MEFGHRVPLGKRNYQEFAHRYAQHVPTKPENAYYERPATLSLLPELEGRRVLDAGCGPGFYTEWFVEHGAIVVAFDVTPSFVEITKQRLGNQAEVLQHDLTKPLSFAADGSLDIVLCALVLGYIKRWQPVFEEFYRVLNHGGYLIFSCPHPQSDWLLNQESNYFETSYFEIEWKGFGRPRPTIGAYRRSLQATLTPLLQAGFVLEQLLEPKPTEDFRAADPNGYEKLMERPSFLCVRARRP